MMLNPQERKEKSHELRLEAAKIAFERNTPVEESKSNGDENLPDHLMSFTKGLPHDSATGLLADEKDFAAFVKGINSGKPQDFKNTPLGPKRSDGKPIWESLKAKNKNLKVRAWESAGAGLAYDLQGPDSHAVSMPPAPKLGDPELTAEMGELYCQALLRDLPLAVFSKDTQSNAEPQEVALAQKYIDTLNKLKWFGDKKRDGEKLTLQNAFRGFTPGDKKGPYLSQFLLTGNRGLNQAGADSKEFEASEGMINYGALTISQKVRQALKGDDHMTNWKEWLDVQNGADFRGMEEYQGSARRFITSGRDLATYVHYDALYQAYLNACLLLLSVNAEYDEGVPFKNRKDIEDHQQGFALFGPPHILTLLTEVCTRALKAVRYQKFNTHRRLRPEAMAARFEKIDQILPRLKENAYKLQNTYDELEKNGIFKLVKPEEDKGSLLLPMAFAEGSPMHPSYGAGHATVAGACVTILKAFFNTDQFINISKDGKDFTVSKQKGRYAFVPDANGQKLTTVESEGLTLEGELNKLAANISIGRNWAGVHYYSDYKESLKLGEEIAIGILEEQSITYNDDEGFYLTLTKFDNTKVRIEKGKASSSTGTSGKLQST